jgi:hypothetical protein
MTAGKRTPRKSATPAAMPVPRIRAIRSDEMIAATETMEPQPMRPRRNRKPKFVF